MTNPGTNGQNRVSPNSSDGNTDELERHITKRFEIQDRLGKGAYGIVWKAFDRKESRIVALKKIFDAFGNGQDAQRTFREVCFLTSFSVHPNIIKLTDIIRAENKNDLYLSFEFMPTDLHALIKSKTGLQDVHIRYIMAQLFRTVYFIHSASVIHRDLKPANILLTHPCEIRVADFGLARSLSDPDVDNFQNGNLTNYVATRWYRSPEILLGSKRYTKGVDIWSLGTILAEMLRGKPLFTGENTIEQINFIRGALAEPTTQDLRYCDTGLVRSVFNYPPHRDFRRPLEHYMRGAPSEAVDLIRRLLHWDPDRRIDLMKAMRHPYVQAFYDPNLVYISDIAVRPFISDDKHFEDPGVYREALYEILHVREINRSTPTSNHPSPATYLAKPEPEGDDITLKSASPRGSISSLEYEPLQTPVPEDRKSHPQQPKPAEPAPAPKPALQTEPAAAPPKENKPLPFAEPVGPGGNPLKHSPGGHALKGPDTIAARGRKPNPLASRQRIIASVEQPALAYKTTNSGSSSSLANLGNPPTNLTRTYSSQNVDDGTGNVARKVVKFEDEVAAHLKKTVKPKPGKGDGDAGSAFVKRFSFDGKSIRDHSLVRGSTPEVTRKFSNPTEQNMDKKSLKNSWRETLSKSHVPDFLKHGGNRKTHQPTTSSNFVSDRVNVHPETTKGSRNGSIPNGSLSVGTFSVKTATNNQIQSSASPSQPRLSPSTYGTLKTGLLHNLKGYGRN